MSAPDLSQFLTPNANGVRELKFRALGTECNIKLRLSSETQSLKFAADALEWIKNFEERYSRYLDNSLVATINSAAGHSWVEIDEDAERLLNVADEVFRKSETSKWAWSNISANVPMQAIREADSEELIREENFNNIEVFRYAKSKNDKVPGHEGLLMDIEVSVQERSKVAKEKPS